MTSKKLGNLLRTAPPATATPEAQAPEAAAVREPPPVPRAAPAVAPDDEPELPLQVFVPRHVRQLIDMKRAESRETLRAITLRAFSSLGIPVTEEDLRDKRGRKRP
jgi:hypothetical protein